MKRERKREDEEKERNRRGQVGSQEKERETGSQRTDTQMSIDASIPCRARQVLIFSIGYVQMVFWVAVLFGQTKVNDVYLVPAFADTHKEVV